MEWLRLLLLSATLIAAFTADAQTAEEEQARLTRLSQAADMIDVVDNMTPDELAEMIGVPAGEDFAEWLRNDPEFLFTPTAGGPLVYIQVSIRDQRIYVTSPEGSFHDKISSGAHDHSEKPGGYRTKRGCHMPYYTNPMHYSQKYDNAPMPNSVFYYKGYAIHATNETGRLGRPASHDCVRTTRPTSKRIFDLVNRYGKKNTRVCVYWSDSSEVASN